MRAFLAIDLPQEILQALDALSRKLQACNAKASWVPPQRMHLTLRFLGEIRDDQCAGLAAQLTDALAVEPSVYLSVSGAGAFGRRLRPDVIWVGVQVLSGELLPILDAIDAAARAQGIMPDEKPFRPHITLARIRDSRTANSLAEALEDEVGFAAGRFACHNVTLYQSKLTPKGPEYSVIRKFPLHVA